MLIFFGSDCEDPNLVLQTTLSLGDSDKRGSPFWLDSILDLRKQQINLKLLIQMEERNLYFNQVWACAE